MTIKNQGRIIIQNLFETKRGRIHIESNIALHRLKTLKLASGFIEQPGYRSIYDDIESLEQVLNRGGNVTIALLDNRTIVGLAILDYSDKRQRWARLSWENLLELKVVEVLREFRNHKIAYYLLSELFSFPEIEQKIIYIVGYSWTWDFTSSDMNKESYRQMLINLYSEFGFMEYPTNEPNICLKPENIFMARLGENVSEKIREKFKWLRFGLFL